MTSLKNTKTCTFFWNIQPFLIVEEIIHKLEFITIVVRVMFDVKNKTVHGWHCMNLIKNWWVHRDWHSCCTNAQLLCFKRIVHCYSHATSSFFGTTYDLLDKASDNLCYFPSQYKLIKSNLDNDIFQQAWQQFKMRAVIKYSRFLWLVCAVTGCDAPSSKWHHSWNESIIARSSLSYNPCSWFWQLKIFWNRMQLGATFLLHLLKIKLLPKQNLRHRSPYRRIWRSPDESRLEQ